MAVHRVRKAEQLAQPVECHLLELLQRRRRSPEDADLVETCDQKLGQDAGLCRRGREVREVPWALPVRDPGHQDVVEIAQDGGKRLRLVGWRGRQGSSHGAGLDPRQHGVIADALEVPRHPLECRRAVFTERAHPRALAIAAQERVFSTCSFVSQPRRAWPIPSSA